jgi:hypothetical protein
MPTPDLHHTLRELILTALRTGRELTQIIGALDHAASELRAVAPLMQAQREAMKEPT